MLLPDLPERVRGGAGHRRHQLCVRRAGLPLQHVPPLQDLQGGEAEEL